MDMQYLDYKHIIDDEQMEADYLKSKNHSLDEKLVQSAIVSERIRSGLATSYCHNAQMKRLCHLNCKYCSSFY